MPHDRRFGEPLIQVFERTIAEIDHEQFTPTTVQGFEAVIAISAARTALLLAIAIVREVRG